MTASGKLHRGVATIRQWLVWAGSVIRHRGRIAVIRYRCETVTATLMVQTFSKRLQVA